MGSIAKRQILQLIDDDLANFVMIKLGRSEMAEIVKFQCQNRTETTGAIEVL